MIPSYKLGDKVLALDDAFASDFREGIALKKQAKNVETGRLFTMQHMIMRNSNKGVYGFVIRTELPEEMDKQILLRLGGDGKIAHLAPTNPNNMDTESINKAIDKNGMFKVYLATPAIFELGWRSRAMYNGYFDDIPDFKFELLTATIGRAEMFGGYDIAANVPKVSFPAVPAGSVYYFRLLKGSPEDVLKVFHDTCISDFRKKQGFGYSFVGGIYNV